jgi:hypothetical protein
VAFAVISPLTVAGAAPEFLLSESTGFLSISEKTLSRWWEANQPDSF